MEHRLLFSAVEHLLADERIPRVRPGDEFGAGAGPTYDAALTALKRRRLRKFALWVWVVVVLRRMRMRATERAFAPGGTGAAAAEGSFNAVRAQQEG